MPITLDAADGVDIISLDLEPKNSLDMDAVIELRKCIAKRRNPLVITGSGDTFSAGVNTLAFQSYSERQRARFFRKITRLAAACCAHEQPVVAAINGHALGAGLVLALCSDQRLVADGHHKFGLTEAAAGVPFPAGALAVVNHELPPTLRRNLTLSSRLAVSGELLDAGVFDQCLPADTLLDAALDRARALAEQPAFVEVKHQVRGDLIASLQSLTKKG